MNHAIAFVLSAIFTLLVLVFQAIGWIDGVLADGMTRLGLPHSMQMALLIVIALMLFIFALRVLGGVFGFLLIVLLVLLVAHLLFPGVDVHSLPNWTAGQVSL